LEVVGHGGKMAEVEDMAEAGNMTEAADMTEAGNMAGIKTTLGKTRNH
jgi:hypothetical protein